MVSVIIPNYNHASYLRQRIESVINQTYYDFEVIILDDCSTDKSKEVIENYRRHPKIAAIVYNEVNSGSTFRQWKKGIERIRGDWVWIAESDDVADKYFLEKLMRHATWNDLNHIALIYCLSNFIDGNGLPVEYVDQVNISGDEELIAGIDFINNTMYLRNYIPNASAVIFRKDLFEKCNRNFLKLKLCGDWLLWMHLIQNGNIMVVKEKLNYFRVHSNTVRQKIVYEIYLLETIYVLFKLLKFKNVKKERILRLLDEKVKALKRKMKKVINRKIIWVYGRNILFLYFVFFFSLIRVWVSKLNKS